MPLPRVLILYNEPVLAPDHPDYASEADVLNTVAAVAGHLAGRFEVSQLGISTDPGGLLDGLKRHRPDAVFNLFEGTASHGETEAQVAGLLDWLHIPFTGCPFATLCLARNKPLTKTLLRGAGLPTPEFTVVERLPLPPCPLPWPRIVKPAAQDASVGLDHGSVVTDQGGLERKVADLLGRYGPPVLVEQFIPGREFNVGVVQRPELRALPVSEIEFRDNHPDHWHIVTYDAKWDPASADFLATPPRCPADVEPALAHRLARLAEEAFLLLGCRDYARVDFRATPAGEPYILEVNPNPDFSPTAGLANGLRAAGISHAEFTVELVRGALARRMRGPD